MIRAVIAPALALLVLLALPGLAFPALAQDTMPPAPYAYNQLDDPALEAEAAALMQTLRCLKCQSQSIADSDAPMAGDMRHQVRSRIAAGESPEAIRAWLIARYGDYVSYNPTISATTWPLFAIPVLVILIGAGVLLRRLGKRRGDSGDAA
jgi:cytochrome c-type biogenesis protein CcmH/NrfF